ncbi:MAG: flagellar hook-basal body complex protein, partial [Mariprofundales bacterium]|nr:flagellar hook-basal body complex protein [Mariprofundales bacterium]
MGIYNALFTGASGLSSFGEAVRVIGDNIANVNSLGFKSQNVVFSDVLSQTVNVSRSNIANQVGNGVRIGQITRDAQQGSIQSTTNATDMAINGRGMFALKDPASGQTFYSRAGAFFLDKSFNLIDGQGFVVQGWQTDTTGVATGNVRDITFANLAAQASATTKVDVGVSIDSTAIKPGAAFNPNDATTYNYKTDVSVFDSLGATHSVSVYFVKQGLDANGQTSWDWHVAVAGNELAGADASTPTTPVEVGGAIYDINT